MACGVSRDGSKACTRPRRPPVRPRGQGLPPRGRRGPGRSVPRRSPTGTSTISWWSRRASSKVLSTIRRSGRAPSPARNSARPSAVWSLRLAPRPRLPAGRRRPRRRCRACATGSQGYGSAMRFVAWISLMLVVPGLVLPGATRVFVDDILINQFAGWLDAAAGRPCRRASALQLVLTTVQEQALMRMELKLALDHSAQFVWHVLRLPIEFFNQRFTGDLTIASRPTTGWRPAAGARLRRHRRDVLHRGGARHRHAALQRHPGDDCAHRRRHQRGGAPNRAARLADVAMRLETEEGKLYAISVVGLQSIETLKATGTRADFFAKWAGHHARALTPSSAGRPTSRPATSCRRSCPA